jgi:hypothetical protein
VILEGIVTTRNEDGTINIAPMGPVVDETMAWLQLRPFQTATTFANLERTKCGVFHVVDDVLLLARAAIGRLDPPPPVQPAEKIDGAVLSDCCRWYEFAVESSDSSGPRAEMRARVMHMGRLRDFFGFNRAKHAVLEAAILSTRIHLVPPDELKRTFGWLKSPVDKTAGPREREAFALLEEYVEECLSSLM